MKEMIMKRLLLVISFLFLVTNVPAQEESGSKFSADAGAELVSRYIWRGSEWGGNSPAIQPFFSICYNLSDYGILEFGAWGNYMFQGSFTENDFTLKYSLPTEKYGVFSLGLTDYLFPYLNVSINNFEGNGDGAHTLDVTLEYEGPEEFPFSLLFSQLAYNDYPDFKSFYTELGYSFTISGMTNKLFCGVALGPSDWNSVMTDKPELINLGYEITKGILVSEAYMAYASAAFIVNWHLKSSYLVFKLTI